MLRAAPIAGTAKNTPHDFLYTETLDEAIWSDPAWNGGFYANSADVRAGLAMFFPVRDCAAEQQLIEGSELRVIESISGHLGLFCLEPSYMEQIDRHLARRASRHQGLNFDPPRL
ncbi:MAG TPA: hypothetical protein VNA67_10660 [Pseudonocardiaceae bacterium]|nr:hypothetical protein [Pseudonocardiaceae bacterium]